MLGLGVRIEFLFLLFWFFQYLGLNILPLELCSQCFITKVFTVRRLLGSDSKTHCIHKRDNVFVRINFNGKSSIQEDERLGG